MEAKCACKGVRTCLFCENFRAPSKHAISKSKVRHPFVFCPLCELCWPGWRENPTTGLDGVPLRVPGIAVYEDFLTPEEEKDLVEDIDRGTWVMSQSGRRKQDYGPKVNFKKKKVKADGFKGLPRYFTHLEDKMLQTRCISDFRAVELCNLDYEPDRGSCIDPHYDDWWLWGSRLVTFNLLSDTVLTLSKSEEHWKLANENLIVESDTIFNDAEQEVCERTAHSANCDQWSKEYKDRVSVTNPPRLSVVQIVLPRRSMLVLWDDARYKWHHSILREDVEKRRMALTVRELSEEFLEDGASYGDVGAELLSIAKMRV
ncbi:alpha-ketoglutarate-dependent dioxygenase alkB homolog 4-like [Ornithodoros turicata]|uniref:alpha-ketoglutarate-dependent dioxygenase alkB homolog 4-like n=1 Tax=Ornithodoros turicata TaxID=34597 RepID=UPI003138A7F6